MANRGLFLHETIDIIGQGQYDYMEHVRKEPVQRMPSMMTLQGTFFVCAVGGGRWPQVVNIWDLGPDGWEGWARNVDRLNLKRRSAFYGDWWDAAAQWRTGGFDRLCGAVPASPTTADLAAAGIRASLFVNEVHTVRPGCALEYLAAVVAERVPLMREHGHEPVGLYEVLGSLTEVVMVWATSVADQARLRAARDASHGLGVASGDPRLAEWERRSAEFVTGGTAEVMTPLPGTVYGPLSWEDASLDDWFAGP
jgi:hypothetical protein